MSEKFPDHEIETQVVGGQHPQAASRIAYRQMKALESIAASLAQFEPGLPEASQARVYQEPPMTVVRDLLPVQEAVNAAAAMAAMAAARTQEPTEAALSTVDLDIPHSAEERHNRRRHRGET